jgi:hypothetical protein
MRSRSLAVLLAAAACEAGTDPNTADVSGRWAFTETLEDRAHGISCADTGTYDIVQTGDRFTGVYAQRGVCQTPTGSVNNADSGTVDAGRVVGRTVRFKVTANCEYQGSASGMPAATLAGRGVCVLEDVNRTLNFLGTWNAVREPSAPARSESTRPPRSASAHPR